MTEPRSIHPKHQCPAAGCPKSNVPESRLACPRHWAMVSRQGQQMVWDAHRAGDFAALVDAMFLAVLEMNAHPGSRTAWAA